MKKTVSTILKISITLGLLVFLFYKTDVRAMAAQLQRADLRWLAAAFFVFVLLYGVGLCRWRVLLEGYGVRVPLPRLSRTFLIAQFFNLVLPSMIGGDTMRILDISAHTRHHSSAILATVVLDRVAGFFGLLTVLIVGLGFGYRKFGDPVVWWSALALLGILVFLVLFLFSRKFYRLWSSVIPWKGLREYMTRFHEAALTFRGKTVVLVHAWLISILIQASIPLTYYFFARALGAPLSIGDSLILVPIVMAFSSIPISLGGLGVRDAASVVLFAKVGIAAEQAFALSLLNFFFLLVLGILGGLAYVIVLPRRRI